MNGEMKYLDAMEQALALQIKAIRERRTELLAEAELAEELDGVPEMIPITEAMKRSGMSRPIITKLCNSGQIPHIRVGEAKKKILINFDALQQYMRSAGKTA